MKPTPNTAKPLMKPTARSKTTNARLRGKVMSRSLFVDGDGRSPWARRYRDLVALFADDAGGLETLTELKLSLIRRVAALVCECERLENSLADGEEVDVDLLARMSSHIRRISETIGLNRVQRSRELTLQDIIAQHAAQKAEERVEKTTARDLPLDPLPRARPPSLFDDDAREATP